MKVYSATEAADIIGVPARTLRRHLRMSEAWKSAGFGGRYQFTETDVRALRRELKGGRGNRPVRAPKKEAASTPLPDMIPAGTHVKYLAPVTRRDPIARAGVESRYDARQARLLARLDEVAAELVTA